jgi:predicted nucleotidyltransferase
MDRLDPVATRQTQAAIDLVRDALGEAAEGMYLYGSAVRGGLRPESDLDLLVVARRPTSLEERRHLIGELLTLSRSRTSAPGTRHLEVTVVVGPALRPWRYPPPLDLQYGDWWREVFAAGDLQPWTSPNPDLAVVLTAARAEAVTLFGPPLPSLLDPIPADDLERALHDVIPDLLGDLDADTGNVLLTLARVWFSLATHEIAPKDIAADWALARLPSETGDAVRRARAGYLDPRADPWTPVELDGARTDASVMVEAIRRTGTGRRPRPG